MLEIMWQESKDGSVLRNTTTTEASYTIEDLTPSATYDIHILYIVICKGELVLPLRSSHFRITTTGESYTYICTVNAASTHELSFLDEYYNMYIINVHI